MEPYPALGNAEAVSGSVNDFHLQRDGISRDQDRWLLKYPYAHGRRTMPCD